MAETVLPQQVRSVLEACARGELSPPVALLRLLLVRPEPATLRRWLEACASDQPAAAILRDLLDRQPEQTAGTAAVLRLAEGHEVGDLAACAALFDRAVARNPQAAVAAYSLGDEALLTEATAELAGLLDRLGVLGATRHVLDLGCGIGRLEQVVAQQVASITGIDISPGMIRVARERCAGLSNVTLLETGGRNLRMFADGAFDTVVAVDTFPYLFQVGGRDLVQALAIEAARVLRPGGDLVVLNMSYRGDLDRDREDATAVAGTAGFDVLRNGTSDLALWDGRTFHFRLAA